MKTREELISRYKPVGDNPNLLKTRTSLTVGTWHIVESILSADSEEQLKCPYCHGGRKAKPIVETSSDFLAFDKNGIVAFGNDGSVTTGEDYTKIKYCPMCGRKLGDE